MQSEEVDAHYAKPDRSNHAAHGGMRRRSWKAAEDHAVPDDVARLLAGVPEWFGQPQHFYTKRRFLPLEETDLWGAGAPCLIMVRPIDPTSTAPARD